MTDLLFQRTANRRRLVEGISAIPGVVVPSDMPPPIPGAPMRRSLVSTLFNDVDGTVKVIADDSLSQSVLDQITAVVNAHDATPDPVPDTPDFGADVPDNFEYQLATIVGQIRTYLGLTATQAAQPANVVPYLRALGRLELYRLKRQLG